MALLTGQSWASRAGTQRCGGLTLTAQPRQLAGYWRTEGGGSPAPSMLTGPSRASVVAHGRKPASYYAIFTPAQVRGVVCVVVRITSNWPDPLSVVQTPGRQQTRQAHTADAQSLACMHTYECNSHHHMKPVTSLATFNLHATKPHSKRCTSFARHDREGVLLACWLQGSAHCMHMHIGRAFLQNLCEPTAPPRRARHGHALVTNPFPSRTLLLHAPA